MIEKITFTLMLVLSIALAGYIYIDQPKEQIFLKQGSQVVIEQDVRYLKKRIAALESELNISIDYLDK